MNRLGHNRWGKEPLTPLQKFDLWQMREAGIPMSECMLWFKRSKSTLDRAMREMRAAKGHAERPKMRGQFSRAYLTRIRTQETDTR